MKVTEWLGCSQSGELQNGGPDFLDYVLFVFMFAYDVGEQYEEDSKRHCCILRSSQARVNSHALRDK